MLKYFITKTLKGLRLSKPRVLIGVPMGITEVERRAVLEAAGQAGAKDAYLIDEPVAAAIGAGLPVEEPRGSMIIDIGGGTTEVAVLALGGIVVGKSIRAGGDEMNNAIVRMARRNYNMEIGERTAELIKIENGWAFGGPENEHVAFRGKSLESGLPASLDVSVAEVTNAMTEPLHGILEAVLATLEKIPPELAADIMECGMTLSGGGALLKNIDRFLMHKTELPVHIAENPLSCVAMGTGKVIEELSLFRKVLPEFDKKLR